VDAANNLALSTSVLAIIIIIIIIICSAIFAQLTAESLYTLQYTLKLISLRLKKLIAAIKTIKKLVI